MNAALRGTESGLQPPLVAPSPTLPVWRVWRVWRVWKVWKVWIERVPCPAPAHGLWGYGAMRRSLGRRINGQGANEIRNSEFRTPHPTTRTSGILSEAGAAESKNPGGGHRWYKPTHPDSLSLRSSSMMPSSAEPFDAYPPWTDPIQSSRRRTRTRVSWLATSYRRAATGPRDLNRGSDLACR